VITMNKPLFQIYALNRSGHRVSAIETSSDRDRVDRIVGQRNAVFHNKHWVAVEIDRATGRPVGSVEEAHADLSVSIHS